MSEHKQPDNESMRDEMMTPEEMLDALERGMRGRGLAARARATRERLEATDAMLERMIKPEEAWVVLVALVGAVQLGDAATVIRAGAMLDRMLGGTVAVLTQAVVVLRDVAGAVGVTDLSGLLERLRLGASVDEAIGNAGPD
ncbi:hypothetical protein [Rathayibacter sp. AY1C5]|uniref:hypothetical protein n=1 Tax=Rathayibacter sp. AY1C5 TaxID=2080538 RepID=UPI000CE8FA92|nr:hypothetical protein [Rathayibacter sp. AY1C5]PPG61623.1 hypothetical protein C5C57_00915 [Rathayibacter sp. AY1C5]